MKKQQHTHTYKSLQIFGNTKNTNKAVSQHPNLHYSYTFTKLFAFVISIDIHVLEDQTVIRIECLCELHQIQLSIKKYKECPNDITSSPILKKEK